jgi:hypothetical protein
MTSVENMIGNLLSQWNPVGVTGRVPAGDYSSHMKEIIRKSGSIESLVGYLEHLVKDVMGLKYDTNDINHRSDLENIAKLIHTLVFENTVHCMFCNDTLLREDPESVTLSINHESESPQEAFARVRCLRKKAHRQFPLHR